MAAYFSVGSIECRLISDGVVAYPPEEVFTGVPSGELEEALRGRLDENGLVPIASNCLLIRTAGHMSTFGRVERARYGFALRPLEPDRPGA